MKKLIVCLLVILPGIGGYLYLNKEGSMDECSMYSYEELSSNEKKFYNRLYNGFVNRNDEIYLFFCDDASAKKVYAAVMADHPELYYVDASYSWQSVGPVFKVKARYIYTQKQVDEYNAQLNKIAKKLISSDYDTVTQIKVIYDYIIDHCVYATAKDDQQLISCLINGRSVCAGYAKGYQYLLEMAGIKTHYMTGHAKEEMNSGDNEGHGWLMIDLNGEAYFSDVTWGDFEVAAARHKCYSYFLMNEEEMLSNYVPDCSYPKTKHTYDYFKETGNYLKSYDLDAISKMIKHSSNRVVEIKCDSLALYKKVANAFENTDDIYKILHKNGYYVRQIKEIKKQELNTIEIIF